MSWLRRFDPTALRDTDRRPRELALAPQPLIAADRVVVTAEVVLTARARESPMSAWSDDLVEVLEVLTVATLRAAAAEKLADDLLLEHHLLADRLQRTLGYAPVGPAVTAEVRLSRGTPAGDASPARTVVRLLDA